MGQSGLFYSTDLDDDEYDERRGLHDFYLYALMLCMRLPAWIYFDTWSREQQKTTKKKINNN